jgi:hypothetical protein
VRYGFGMESQNISEEVRQKKNQKISTSLIRPLQGLRFGRLTVLRFDQIRNHSAYWICLCDCGKEKSIISGSLRPNGSKSCGCLRKEIKAKPRKPLPIEDRFWQKVQKTNDCWLWTAYTDSNGYGEIHCKNGNSRVEYAHRISWMIHFGSIPEGMEVCHKCDVPRCVRPDHLFLGTQYDNIHDCIDKKRNPILIKGRAGMKGEDHPLRKLTEEQVIEIRRRYVSGVNQYNPSNRRELAEEFGINPTHVWQVYARKVWKHIT